MITVVRVVVTYIAILLGLRILGKREFGQLTPMELVALILIPELASQAIIGPDYSVTGAIIAIATLLTLVYFISLMSHFSNKFSKAIAGEPLVVVHNGKLLQDAINLERVEVEEIYSEMHKVGLERLDQVKWAILENDGSIAIIPYQAQGLHSNDRDNKLA